MEANYNTFLTKLLWHCEDSDAVDSFIQALKEKRVTLQVEYLNDESFASSPLAEIKSLLDQILETNRLKMKCIGFQDFEGAAINREKERNLHKLINQQGFSLYYLEQDRYALYHVDTDAKERFIKFFVYTNSHDLVGFIEGIRERVSEGK